MSNTIPNITPLASILPDGYIFDNGDTLDFAAVLKRTSRNPLDAFTRFITYNDLQNYANNFVKDDKDKNRVSCLAYEGQIVSVYNDTTNPEKNGVYYIKSVPKYDDATGFKPAEIVKISGGGDGGLDIDDLSELIAEEQDILDIFKDDKQTGGETPTNPTE